MIKIESYNDKYPDYHEITVDFSKFPDGTLLIKSEIPTSQKLYLRIVWQYEEQDELSRLIYLTYHIRDHFKGKLDLYMPYIPNARMDRVKDSDEVFTLKYFAKIINSLHFNKVRVLDAHSNVSLALIDNVEQESVKFFIEEAAGRFCPNLLFMPDEGAHKRYSSMIDMPSTFGIKIRDWRTGEIQDYRLADPDLIDGKRVLIVDDISSKGGTFYFASKLLKEHGAKDVGLYVTHCETTIKDGNLFDKDTNISRIYTHDPLWNPEKVTDENLKKIIIL